MFGNLSSNLTFRHFTIVQYSINSLLIYALVAVIGIVSNVNSCVLIASNKFMHTTTNCYLFNLAISDIMILIWAVPIYNTMTYSSDFVCKFRAEMSITSVYVTILTVGVFSVERYLAICHPFLVNWQLSSVARAIKAILII